MLITTSRRNFLKSSLSSAALVALAPTVPQLLLSASAQAAAASAGEKILVVIQLTGGNDGLNTVIPYGDDAYYSGRPNLRIAKDQVRKVSDYIGLHPSLEGFSKLLEDGKLGIVQGVGYPNPNRSHFSSMDIWHTAQPEIVNAAGGEGETARNYQANGWLGRYLDTRTAARQGGEVPALHLGATKLPLALVGNEGGASSADSLDLFKLNDGGDARLRDAIARVAAASRQQPDDMLSFLQHGTLAALESSKQVQEALGQYKTEIKYPDTGLARRLKTVAQLIDAGLKTRIYYLELDGFDTHANQAAAHAGLLAELGGAMTAFVQDVAQHGHDKRVLVTTFSEFGRRLRENASQGTDHGAAAPLFVAGGAVRTGLIGKYPSLTDLDEGDLKHTADFREVYAAILESWLQVDSKLILGKKFTPLSVTV